MKSLEFELNIEDLIQYNLYMFFNTEHGRRVQRLVRTALFLVFVLAAAFIIYIYRGVLAPVHIVLIIAVFFATVLGVLHLMPAFIRWNIVSNVKKVFGEGDGPGHAARHRIETHEEGIKTRSEHGWNTFPWRIIRKIEETDDYAFIFVSEGQAVMIPRAKTEGDLAGFLEEVRGRAGCAA